MTRSRTRMEATAGHVVQMLTPYPDVDIIEQARWAASTIDDTCDLSQIRLLLHACAAEMTRQRESTLAAERG